MPETTAAGLLALVGIAGTTVSSALTDKINPRILLAGYYFFRGIGLLVLGWVFAAHQIGAAIAAAVAGVIRDSTGEYTIVWFGAAALCAVAAAVSYGIRRTSAPLSE